MATTKKSAAKKTTPQKPAPKKSSAKKPTSADAVDEQLARYRDMRHFDITAEPSGADPKSKKAATARTANPAAGLPFVIQKHAASHLHYDFRLGWNGVLKSWAVAKGPSYNVKDRRLAVQVEDHPMEYGGFEGIIPKGQYGGGTVMVWDQGTWSPQPGHEDIDTGLREGSLKFEMHGTKMQGKWTLVRMNPKPNSRWGNNGKPNWLLIKEHDDFERGPDDPSITDEAPNSAVTGRTLDQIAAQEDHVWNSKETAGTGQAWYRNEASPSRKNPVILSEGSQSHREPQSKNPELRSPPQQSPKLSPPKSKSTASKLPKETQPAFLSPQLALEATTPPAGTNWLHELKLDGYRIQARKSGTSIKLLTRKGLDWTHRMKPVAEAVAALPTSHLTLDGEVCVLAPNGTTSFADLQAWFQNDTPAPLTYFAFDLLHLNGHNTRGLPLRERKALLTDLLIPSESLQLSEHLETGGEAMFHHACELHAEGIISKRADAPYTSGRSSSWLKSKCLREQEFVIAGFTDSTEGPDRIGSLLLGVYDASGKTLLYTGRTGTGFTQKLKRQLRTDLNKLETKTLPFSKRPADARSDVHWVMPKLVAQVRFATWTADNLVRQAAFLGLREDKPASEVRREEPTVAPKPKHSNLESEHLKSLASKKTRNSKLTAPSSSQKINTAKPTTKSPSPSHLYPSHLRLTHPDKLLDPASHLTKRELADYYWAIAEHMLPHIADRPLSLVRCPEGAGKPCFYQKHTNHMLPPGVGSVMVTDKKSGKPEPYITLNTAEAIAGLAQMGVLEVHPWGSRNDDLEHPDRIIFDLDPDESLPWSTLTAAAADVRARLKKAGLTSFLKTTGGKGLHIVAPITPEHAWPEVKAFTHRFVLSMERANPLLYLTKMTKAARTGKIYLDYLRNERGATAVAPFSPRARAGAPVSLPLPWSALKLPERPTFSVKEFAHWQNQLRPDPWKALSSTHQSLDLKAI